MSDIPQARKELHQVLTAIDVARTTIIGALRMLDRRKPDFRAHRETPTLTAAQKRRCQELRKKGYSILRIARIMKTNHGRVSEAVSGRAHK
jgi:hypothetical protein